MPANVIRNLGESILKPKLRGILDEDGYSTLNQVICNFIVSGHCEMCFFDLLTTA